MRMHLNTFDTMNYGYLNAILVRPQKGTTAAMGFSHHRMISEVLP